MSHKVVAFCIFVDYTCSFDLGPAHIISFSTEVYYYLQYGFQQIINQRKWLEEDLKVETHKRVYLLDGNLEN